MYFDQKGPLVLSATLHLVALLSFFVWTLVQPEKEAEELIFELVSAAPSSSSPVQDLPSMEELFPARPPRAAEPLEELPVPEPTPAPIPAPKPVPRPVPKPAVPAPAPKPPEPKPQTSYEDFFKNKPNEIKNVAKTPPPQQRKVDISKYFEKVTDSLQNLANTGIAPTDLQSLSSSDQSELNSYFAALATAVSNAIEGHPRGLEPLRAEIRISITATGYISVLGLASSSGDSVFDRKALDAFKSIRYFKPVPGGKGYPSVKLVIYQ